MLYITFADDSGDVEEWEIEPTDDVSLAEARDYAAAQGYAYVVHGDGQAAVAVKPRVQIIGTDGNVFAIIGRVRRALADAGQRDRANEWVERATSATSYDAVLQLMFEYVDPF